MRNWVFLFAAILAVRITAPAQQPTQQLSSWSKWKQILLENRAARSYVRDTRFEFRWKPEWTENGYACSAEIRPTNDADQSATVPEIDIWYNSTSHTYAAAGVPVGPKAEQEHYFATSAVQIGNKAAHASFNLPDCGRVVAVAAGHFYPDVAVPAF